MISVSSSPGALIDMLINYEAVQVDWPKRKRRRLSAAARRKISQSAKTRRAKHRAATK